MLPVMVEGHRIVAIQYFFFFFTREHGFWEVLPCCFAGNCHHVYCILLIANSFKKVPGLLRISLGQLVVVLDDADLIQTKAKRTADRLWSSTAMNNQ